MKILSTPKSQFYAFVAFSFIVLFTGGASRGDVQSLIILRPLAVLFCAYALTVKAPGLWSERKFPLYILGALGLLMVLQSIPLPPAIWTALPGRQIFADIANIARIEQPWRPMTLSPSRTLNSLLSLAVPFAMMMLYLNLDHQHRKRAVSVIIVLCSISALWAIFQVIGPARGPLFIYRITNYGTGVGLFANRNHQAVMLASTITMLGWYASSLQPNAKQATLKYCAAIATILVLVPLIFITGSRAGLILMIPALVLALFFIYAGNYTQFSSKRANSSRSRKERFSRRFKILAIGIVAILGMVFSSILFSRSLAFDRLLIGNEFEELRLQLLPTLITMIRNYMPWGSGFGTFEFAFNVYEPQELLRPSYLNQAHNDWVQYLIEGGVPALLITLGAVFWLATRLWLLAKNWRAANQTKYRVLACFAVIMFVVAASIGDYPLRVPSIMAIFAALICIFDDGVRSIQQRDNSSV